MNIIILILGVESFKISTDQQQAFSKCSWKFGTFNNFFFYFSKIVLVAVQDEGSKYVKTAFDALTRMGGYDLGFLDYRGSYALVGHPGDQKPSYVTQVQSKSGQGPSVISMTVPLTISRLYNCYTTFVRKKFKLSLCDTFACSRISLRFLDNTTSTISFDECLSNLSFQPNTTSLSIPLIWNLSCWNSKM